MVDHSRQRNLVRRAVYVYQKWGGTKYEPRSRGDAIRNQVEGIV